MYKYDHDLQVNCIGVLDSVLGTQVRLGGEEFDAGRLDMHPCDKKNRPLAIISPTGKWEGEDDGGWAVHTYAAVPNGTRVKSQQVFQIQQLL